MLLFYPNWRPKDVKEMTPRERKYWEDMAKWKAELIESKTGAHSNG